MTDDMFDEVGFAELSAVFRKYSDNFKELDFDAEDSELMALNPKAFSVTTPCADITKTSSPTAKMLNDLFEASPTAKVLRIKVSPSMAEDKDWSVENIGGTITISGTF